MGLSEVLFLQMKLHLISHMKFVWYSMLIVELLVLGIGFMHTIMNLLLDVLDVLNKFGFLINLSLSMGGLFMCEYSGQSYINGGQWLEPKAHLKSYVANRVVEGYVVAMLNIRKDFIPCTWIFLIVHPQNMENHLVDYLCLSINLWVEGS
jgi:hypothetical protein